MLVEWRDGRGKRLSSAIGNPLNDNETLPDGWIRYGMTTKTIPPESKSAMLHFYVAKGGHGKAVFCGFEMIRLDACSVGPMLSSAYQNVATGGVVRFVVPLHRIEDATVRKDVLRPEFTIWGANGVLLKKRPTEFDLDHAALDVNVVELANGTNPVTFELSSRERSYGASRLDFTKSTKLPPRRVWIDSRNRLIVDGKPFFMLGMYWRRITESELDVFCPSPFNTVLPCQRPDRSQFDLCAARGLKMCYPFEHRYDIPGENTNVARIVNELKDHPALLLWYLNDERPVSLVRQVQARHDLILSLDGQHPTWTVSDKPVNVKSFLGSYEIIGTDVYPIGNALPGYPFPIENVLQYAITAKRRSYGLYPMWHVPQAFSWGWFRKGMKEYIDMRYPTRTELRQMTWQYIAAGANGIMYYAFNALRDNFTGKEFTARWKELKEIAAEVKRFEDIFLSGDEPPNVTGMTHAVGARAWRRGRDIWLLAVNATRMTQKACLELDCQTASGITSVFGTPPIRTSASTFECTLAPLECSLTACKMR